MKKRRYLQTSLILLFATGLMALFWTASSHIALPGGKAPQEPVFGDLGGVPVEIPRVYARFVEYDGDPYFMDRKKWMPPQRTYGSKLRGFSFEARFPDMASVDKRKSDENNIYTNMWLRVLVYAGEHYGDFGDDSANNQKKVLNESHCLHKKCFHYTPIKEKIYGLTGYTPKGPGIELARRKLGHKRGVDLQDRNIYYYPEHGRAISLIRCSNMLHSAAPCKHFFNIEAMRARVSVSYRKELLPHWKEIQERVSNLISGFEVKK